MSAAPAPDTSLNAPWSKGTDLRQDDIGVYTWPHPAIDSPTREHFVSVTTVLDAVCGSELIFVHNWWVANAANKLMELHKEGKKALRWEELTDQQTGEVTWQQTEVEPASLLCDPHWLKNEGHRMMRIAADRGSTAHDLLQMYGLGMPLPEGQKETAEWCEMTITSLKRSCSVDEALPYCLSLADWLAEEKPEILLCEAPVFNREYGYAGTLDLVMRWRNRIWTADLKTAKQTRKSHAMQTAAYKHAGFYGIQGTAFEGEIPASDGTLILLCQPGGVTPREWQDPPLAFESFIHGLMTWSYLNSDELAVTIQKPTAAMPTAERVQRATLGSTPIRKAIRECPFGKGAASAS